MSLIEVVIIIAVFSLIFVGFTTAFQRAVILSADHVQRIQSMYLVEEGHEAVRLIRDSGWASHIALLTRDTPYFLTFVGGSWQLTSVPQPYIFGIYERTVTFGAVMRDANNDIASVGTVDPNTILVTVDVAWRGRSATTTNEVATYLTNMFIN